MSLDLDDRPLVQTVLHPTDFSPASEAAFAHALALALVRKTELTLLHVADRGADSSVWHGFPAVRGTLERWGLLREGSSPESVFAELGVLIKKVALRGSDPVGAILSWLDNEPADLIVLATQGREGMPRWFKPSVSESVARKSKTMTLFVPRGVQGLVDPANGRVSIRRILLPVVREPNPAGAMLFATRVARLTAGDPVELTLLHVGDDNPELERDAGQWWHWSDAFRVGDPVEQILAEAATRPTDLIVMATAGHQGILDALRGSTTEHVVRRAPCPVLAVPSA